MSLLTENAIHYGWQAHQWKQDNVPELNERLREARLAHGYDQDGLAKALSVYMQEHEPTNSRYRNITQAQISKWELGKVKSPGIPVIKAMCMVLNVTLDYMLGIVNDPHSHLTEEGLSDEELLLVRRVRQNPKLSPLLYKMLSINLSDPSKSLASGQQTGE